MELKMPITIRYQIINRNAKLPNKATSESACYDVYSVEDVDISPNEIYPVKTGLKLKPSLGYFIRIYIRSGMAKKGIALANGVGIVDSDYNGECLVMLHNTSSEVYHVSTGHRIAQIEVAKIEDIRFIESNNLGGMHRGFGSTGE